MQTLVKVDTSRLVGKTLKLSKQMRQAVLNSMDDVLDEIRHESFNTYIIKDRYPGKPLRYKRRHQKSDPNKLTSRTGALKKMIYAGQRSWKKGSSTHKSIGPAIQCVNKTISKNTNMESYQGTIAYNIKDASSISRTATAQQLRLRFMHDSKRGVKGKRRPFMTIAADNMPLNKIEEMAKRRLAALGVL